MNKDVRFDIEKMINGFSSSKNQERCHHCDFWFDAPALSCCNCQEPAQHSNPVSACGIRSKYVWGALGALYLLGGM